MVIHPRRHAGGLDLHSEVASEGASYFLEDITFNAMLLYEICILSYIDSFSVGYTWLLSSSRCYSGAVAFRQDTCKRFT